MLDASSLSTCCSAHSSASPVLSATAASSLATAAELFPSNRLGADSSAVAPLVLPSVSPPPEGPRAAPPASGNATHAKGQTGMNGGRWTEQEHQSFLAGLRLYGREWKKVASKIKTRTSAQIRSHAQKYFAKLARDDELRRHNGLPLAGYFSDGGSSTAHHSGEDDADADADADADTDADAGARAGTRLEAMKQADAHMLFSPMGAAVNGLYQPTAGHSAAGHSAAGHKKRSRSLVSGPGVSSSFLAPAATGLSSAPPTFPYKLQKRMASPPKEAAQVDRLPSQEELLAKVSPHVRPRLASLIEAELCALQVLSSYAMLQQHGQPCSSRPKPKQRASRPRKLAAAPAATGSGTPAASLGLSILSTEQIPSTSSIY